MSGLKALTGMLCRLADSFVPASNKGRHTTLKHGDSVSSRSQAGEMPPPHIPDVVDDEAGMFCVYMVNTACGT